MNAKRRKKSAICNAVEEMLEDNDPLSLSVIVKRLNRDLKAPNGSYKITTQIVAQALRLSPFLDRHKEIIRGSEITYYSFNYGNA